MSASVPVLRDARLAFSLSAAFAVAAAATVPLLIDSLPREARQLPLPLPAFCAVLAVQMTAVYGLFALGGLRLARRAGLNPALRDDAPRPHPHPILHPQTSGFLLGLGCGVFLVGVVTAIQRLAPGTLPDTLHPPSFAAALLASVAGSIGEEILFRLFLLSLLFWALPPASWARMFAIAISALVFGAAHSPGFVFLYGGLVNVPALAWIWLLALNGLMGVAFAIAYLRWGILAAMLAHFGTDLVWHVAARL